MSETGRNHPARVPLHCVARRGHRPADRRPGVVVAVRTSAAPGAASSGAGGGSPPTPRQRRPPPPLQLPWGPASRSPSRCRSTRPWRLGYRFPRSNVYSARSRGSGGNRHSYEGGAGPSGERLAGFVDQGPRRPRALEFVGQQVSPELRRSVRRGGTSPLKVDYDDPSDQLQRDYDRCSRSRSMATTSS